MPEVKPIPEGFNTVTPHITCKGASDAIEFYKKAFGAEDLGIMLMPDGETVMHAMIRIGDSMIMLHDEFPDHGKLGPDSLGGSSVTMHLYVEDADFFFERAVQAGAKVTMPLEDTFWGDRYGTLEDPFGHHWSVATHIRDVSPEEMEKAAEEMFGES